MTDIKKSEILSKVSKLLLSRAFHYTLEKSQVEIIEELLEELDIDVMDLYD